MKKTKIKFEVKVKIWKCRNSDSYIAYSKKYDMSGYGKTRKDAVKSFNIAIEQALLWSKPKR